LAKKAWLFGAVALLAALVAAAGVRLTRSVPSPSLTASMVMASRQPSPAQIAWPAVPEAAVSIDGLGQTWTSGSQMPERPMASVTKMMTAYLILRDHPLAAGQDGPALTVSAADEQAYKDGISNGDSGVAIKTGETLTERQALEALMLPSADDIAWVLAEWDAGSRPAFAAKENTVARSLGMDHTNYTDPSGLSPTTVSTAADQLKVVQAAMKNPTFAQIVSMQSATLPVAGTVVNYNRQTGTNGIVGIKTGTTSQAGGCWAFAIKREIGGKARTVYGVVFGAPLSPGNQQAAAAIEDGEDLADAMPKMMSQLTVLPAGTTIGEITVPWSKTQMPVVTSRALSGMAVAGSRITLNTHAQLPGGAGIAQDTEVGQVSANGVTGPAASTPVVTAGPVQKPSLMWKLFG